MTQPISDVPRGLRTWFYAAAFYNALAGLAILLFPSAILARIGIDHLNFLPLFQVIGMMVGVYAYGYYLIARDPIRYAPFVWIGLAGKTFGPIGFLFYAIQGQLPWAFGWMILFDDLIWWPAFWVFALKYGRSP
jgi:hypothetical protein